MSKISLIILITFALMGCGSLSKKEQALYKCKFHAQDNLKNEVSDTYYHNYIALCMGAEGYKRKFDKQCDYKTNPISDESCFD
ncbi:hypothetical protein [Sphingorhabdus sp. EL138]|uniref:hypothetical protein n=1 Tax=Sphingorhabdus sp. EL138 TaxID=2073156 RepID=UPI0025F8E6E5|nr:hypothetical protein [Sphingorhabdus sp. EL138]